MSKYLIVANWKMNPKTLKEAQALFEAVKNGVKGAKEVEVVICPPFVWLSKLNPGAKIKLGAQNCHWKNKGAYTGEVSTPMLTDLGVKYALVGHSERRQFLGETDEIINLKIKAALRVKLRPILCVGEKEGEKIEQIVEGQLVNALAGLNNSQLKEVIIVYEPVWAIGPGDPCLPDNVLSANLFIRRVLTKLSSRFLADQTPILYGGSVEAANAADYISKTRTNGLLVGGASLDPEEFVKIIQSVNPHA